MEENISRSNIESFKLSITKISQNRIDKYELVNIAKNLNIEISSAATFCIQKRMVLKEVLSHVVRVFVTAASFLNISAKTGIVNLSEISYYEILANEHHHISP